MVRKAGDTGPKLVFAKNLIFPKMQKNQLKPARIKVCLLMTAFRYLLYEITQEYQVFTDERVSLEYFNSVHLRGFSELLVSCK